MQQLPFPSTLAPVPHDQPIMRAPRVQVPPDGVQPLATVRTMPLEDQKMLGVFPMFTSPRFSGVVGKDAHEFLTTYPERLHTLGLVESRGVDFISYQLDWPAKNWWCTFTQTRLVGSPSVSWDEFSEAFMYNFIPYSIRDRLKD